MMGTFREIVVEAAARAAFVTWWADDQEEKERNGEESHIACSGQDWMDIAPKTSGNALEFAEDFISRVETLNSSIEEMLLTALDADLEEDPDYQFDLRKYVESFGHYLMMQGLGHGVAWTDDHVDIQLNLPHVEYYE